MWCLGLEDREHAYRECSYVKMVKSKENSIRPIVGCRRVLVVAGM